MLEIKSKRKRLKKSKQLITIWLTKLRSKSNLSNQRNEISLAVPPKGSSLSLRSSLARLLRRPRPKKRIKKSLRNQTGLRRSAKNS